MSSRSEARAGVAFLSPIAVGLLLLIVIPALLTLRFAFTNATGVGPAEPNGLDNIRRAWQDPILAASLRASLVHAAISVPLRLLIAAGLGLLLAAPRRGGRLYRAAVFVPTVVPDVSLALLFLWVLNPIYGPVNHVLGAVGLPQPNWLATPWGARWAIIIMMLFPIGEAFLVVLAARRSLDPELYDAAAVDGAGPFAQLRRITLPAMAPLLTLLAVRDTILTLQVNFVPAYVLTDGRPAFATLYLPVYIYDQAFEFSGFGYGALLSLLLLVVTTLLIGFELLLARRWRLFR